MVVGHIAAAARRGVRLVETVVDESHSRYPPASRLMLLGAVSQLAAGGGDGAYVCWCCLT